MPQVKRLITKQAEEDLINVILKQVKKNNMTILNIKEVTAKVINYLESNATLEMEDLDNAKSSIQEKQKTINKAKDSFNRLSEGKSTINEIRQEYGLNRLENNDTDKKMIIKD